MELRTKNSLVLRSAKLVHYLLIVTMFIATYAIYYRYPGALSDRRTADIATCGVYSIVVYLLARNYAAYGVGYYSISDIVYSQSLSEFIGSFIAYVMLALINMYLMNPIPLLALLAAQLVINVIWSYLVNKLYFKLHSYKETALIFGNERDLSRLKEIRYFEQKFHVEKMIEAPSSFEELISQLDGIECICVAGIESSIHNKIVKYCIENRKTVYVAPSVSDIIMRGARYMRYFKVPILCVRNAAPNADYLILKRFFDIVGSLIGLILMGPFMLITAAIIKISDGGPALYRQVRLTKDGKRFAILKFRSMRVDAEKDGIARVAAENDERITPIGRFIRAIRFDELPQLINILIGDMSFVGPRPERPEIAEQYEKFIPSFPLRLQVKAGLTGFAQVYGKYNTDPYDKLQFDLMYINNMSAIEDMKLMFTTIKILFIKESTEGISDDKYNVSISEQRSDGLKD